MNLSDEIRKGAEWLQMIADQNPYGEAGFRIILHDGRIQRVEKSETVKTRPTDSGREHAENTH